MDRQRKKRRGSPPTSSEPLLRRLRITDRCFSISACPWTDPDAPMLGASFHAPPRSRTVEKPPRDRPIAVYCVCGFQVSGTAVTELRQRGYNARALVGGITAWHAIGGATVPLDTSTYEEAL